MENILHIEAEFKCVFLLNGAFAETAESFRYDFGEHPIYVTVLPLNAHHLSYTVKIMDGKAISNRPLADVYALPDAHYYIKLKPRYSYVYSKNHREPAVEKGPVTRFFNNLKEARLQEARNQLTENLNLTVSDTDLRSFFDGYIDILENKFYGGDRNSYFLINSENRGILFRFEFSGDLIDNIIEI